MSLPDPRSPGNPDLPQLATRGDAAIKGIDWFLEPCWKGQRLLARLRDGHVHLTGEDGRPADPDLGEAARVLEVAIDADQALIDGSWTAMPFVGEGSPARERARAMAKLARTGAMPDPASLETRRAFVAWDLIELDGQRLYDIPYQERRRLLESVIIESIRVRISPAVRPPIRGWLAAWRADGFTHFVAKQPNSRYWPGQTAPDWLEVSIVSEKMPSLLERVFGSRPARMRQAPRQPE